MVAWIVAKYDKLSPQVQKLYDAYADAWARQKALGAELKSAAERAWADDNPNGIDGEYCAFNVKIGTMSWTMTKKKKAGSSYKTMGREVPSARREVSDVELDGGIPTEGAPGEAIKSRKKLGLVAAHLAKQREQKRQSGE